MSLQGFSNKHQESCVLDRTQATGEQPHQNHQLSNADLSIVLVLQISPSAIDESAGQHHLTPSQSRPHKQEVASRITKTPYPCYSSIRRRDAPSHHTIHERARSLPHGSGYLFKRTWRPQTAPPEIYTSHHRSLATQLYDLASGADLSQSNKPPVNLIPHLPPLN